jgi:hypothetical protein
VGDKQAGVGRGWFSSVFHVPSPIFRPPVFVVVRHKKFLSSLCKVVPGGPNLVPGEENILKNFPSEGAVACKTRGRRLTTDGSARRSRNRNDYPKERKEHIEGAKGNQTTEAQRKKWGSSFKFQVSSFRFQGEGAGQCSDSGHRVTNGNVKTFSIVISFFTSR